MKIKTSQIESDLSLQSIIHQLEEEYDGQELRRTGTSQIAFNLNNKGEKKCHLCGKQDHFKRNCFNVNQREAFPKRLQLKLSSSQ